MRIQNAASKTHVSCSVLSQDYKNVIYSHPRKSAMPQKVIRSLLPGILTISLPKMQILLGICMFVVCIIPYNMHTPLG